jgi:hypothetical protein
VAIAVSHDGAAIPARPPNDGIAILASNLCRLDQPLSGIVIQIDVEMHGKLLITRQRVMCFLPAAPGSPSN